MKVSIIQDLEHIDARKWDNFVKQDPGHTVFSSYGWLIALQNGLGYEPCHVLVEEGSTSILALTDSTVHGFTLRFNRLQGIT